MKCNVFDSKSNFIKPVQQKRGEKVNSIQLGLCTLCYVCDLLLKHPCGTGKQSQQPGQKKATAPVSGPAKGRPESFVFRAVEAACVPMLSFWASELQERSHSVIYS